MSRSDARSTSLRRRPSRTVPATIVSVVLIAAGVLAVVAAVYAVTGRGWPSAVTMPASTVAGWTWGSAAMITVTALMVVVGLVLLIAAIKPGGHNATQLAAPSGAQADVTDLVISNRALSRLAASTADGVDGVDRVSTSASARLITVAVTTATRDQADDVRRRVEEAVSARVRSLGLQPAPRVRASVTTRAS